MACEVRHGTGSTARLSQDTLTTARKQKRKKNDYICKRKTTAGEKKTVTFNYESVAIVCTAEPCRTQSVIGRFVGSRAPAEAEISISKTMFDFVFRRRPRHGV